MKTIKTYILILLAALFVKPADIMAQASTPGFAPDGVVLNKNVVPGSQPNTYTINLEAFVTGSTVSTTTQVSAPCDYVLVLDNSSSMTWNLAGSNGRPQRIDLLKEAASNFIDLVKADAEKSNTEHRISIVSFGAPKFLSDKSADQKYNDPSNSNFLKEYTPASDEKLKYTYVLKSFTDVNATNYASLKSVINRLDAEGQNTASHYGMQLAYLLIHHQSRTTDSKGKPVQKIIIFLTDGEPTINGNASWADKTEGMGNIIEGNYKIADMTIDYAHDAKKDGASIWGLSIIKDINTNNQIYMECVSSNYPNATKFGSATYSSNTKWKNHTAPYDRGEGDFFYDVSKDKDALKNAFAQIAQETSSGGASYGLTKESTTVIDVVAPAFKLPDGADGSKITLQVAECIKVNPYVFDVPVNATSKFPGIVAKVGNLDKDKQFVEANGGNTVQVKGFDFSENYVGEDINNGVKTTRGYKLIISFPIEVAPSCPGGANVATNTADSGIYFDEDGDGKYDQIGGFDIPHAKIPNLVIKKTGLHKGESATFYVYKLEKDGSKSQFPIVLVVTQTSDDPSTPCYARAKIQEPGRYEVEETPWSWAYYISTRVKDYAVDDKDKGSTPDSTWNELGYGDKGLGYQAEKPWKYGTEVPDGTRSIIRNVNDFTEDPTLKGTLFSFTNKDKDKMPAHGEASKNNVFYETK